MGLKPGQAEEPKVCQDGLFDSSPSCTEPNLRMGDLSNLLPPNTFGCPLSKSPGSPPQGPQPSGSTYVRLDLSGEQHTSPVNSKGGRQKLNFYNGALDLSWNFNGRFDAPYDADLPYFKPGGTGASFGFLAWYHYSNRAGAQQHYLIHGKRGIMFAVDFAAPEDPRSSDQYYFAELGRFHQPSNTYFWYDPKYTYNLPRYVARRVRRDGTCIYYNYDQTYYKLDSLTGHTGRLTAYFGYDSASHINRIYLQDKEGNDHRETYYYYNGNALTTIVEPENVVTYFTINPSSIYVTHEVDPDNVPTYLVYNTASPFLINRVSHDTRLAYFKYLAHSYIDSASNLVNGPSKMFRRTYISNDIYNIDSQGLNDGNVYFIYDSVNRLARYAFDKNGNTRQFAYSARKLMIRTQEPDLSTTYYNYTVSGYDLTSVLGPRYSSLVNQATYFGYLPGNNGVRVQQLDPQGAVTYYGYDARSRLVRVQWPNSGTSYYFYDNYDQKLCEIDAQGAVSYFAYNANLYPTVSQNALANTTYFSYDKMDQKLSQYSPAGEVQYFSYTKRGLLAVETRAGGRVNYYGYDGYKNVVRSSKVTETGLATQYFEYDTTDNPTLVTDTLGRSTRTLFDWSHRRTLQQDAVSAVTYFWYDANGNEMYRGGPLSFWNSNQYDSRDRVAISSRGVVGPRAPAVGTTYYAHWSLDETTGTRFDSSLQNNLLYPKNGASYAPGIVGNAAKLVDTSKNYFSLDNTSLNRLSITGDLTAACWIKADNPYNATNFFQVILSKENSGASGWSLYIETPAIIKFIAYTSGGLSFSEFASLWDLRNWTHLAITRRASNGDVCFYLNGWMALRNIYGHPAGTISTNTTPFLVGGRYSGATVTNFFSGLVDNVYVVDKVLNYCDIAQLANSRINPTYAAENTDLQTSYFGYDYDNNLVQQLGERGFASYFSYDALNRVTTSLDSVNSATYFAYDLMSNRTASQNARGAVSYFGYDLVNRLTQSSDSLGQATYFGYDAVGNFVNRLTPGGISAYFAYDGSNRLVAQQDSELFTTYYAYDGVSNRIQILNPRQFVTYFAYNLLDQNTAILDATGQPSYFAYDTEANLLTSLDHVTADAGAATYFGYDAVNRLVVIQDALNRVSYFGYDEAGNQTRVSSPGNRDTYFAYDRFSRQVAQLSSMGNNAYFGYDAANNRVVASNARGIATYFGFDPLNRLDRSLDALNGAAYFGYDAVGNLSQTQDVRGFATYFAYDLLDRMTEMTDAVAGVTQRAYNPASTIHAVLPPAGNAVYFAYDLRRLPTATLDGMGNASYFGYDANGNRGRAQSPRGFGSYFNYDALDRFTGLLDAEGGTAYFGYDAGSNVQRIHDALGRDTYFNFDQIDRPLNVFDALQNSVYFAYDAAGNRAVECDARDNSTYYSYDLDNRLSAMLDPLGSAAYYAYDASSNLARTLNNNGTAIYFSYDALDRRTAIQYPSETQTFAFDAAGNLTTVQDNWGDSYFAYDGISRSVARSTPRGDAIYYAYDGASNLLIWQYPQDGAACYYEYDGAQRMVHLLSTQGNTVEFDYDASSNVTRKTFGNGTISWAEFDRAERFTAIRYTQPNGTAITYFDFGRDISGRITRIARETDLVQYYEYDALDRLTAETWRRQSDASQIYAFTYEYDATGNRLRMRRETAANTEWDSTYYSYAADNSLTQRQVLTPPSSLVDTYFGYDANGALVRQMEDVNTTYFEYGPHQLVTKVTPPLGDGQPWEFYYDGRLNRYKIDRAGTIRYLLWDGLNCMEERNNDGSLYARYTYGYTRIYGIGSCVEIYKPGAPDKTYTLLMDHRGTGYTLLDETSAEVGRRYYDAFGVILGQTGTWPTDLAYQTNWQTVQIGNQWWGLSASRMYNNGVGVFSQKDPLHVNSSLTIAAIGNVWGIYDSTVVGAGLNKWFQDSYFGTWHSFFRHNPVKKPGGLNAYLAPLSPNEVDPYGLFHEWIHEQITREALEDSGLTPECINMIVKGNLKQDEGHEFNDDLNHGDNNKIEQTVRRLISNIDSAWVNCKCDDPDMNKKRRENAMEALGKAFHALQDLYSHADYVERMDNALGERNSDDNPKAIIPLWKMFNGADGQPSPFPTRFGTNAPRPLGVITGAWKGIVTEGVGTSMVKRLDSHLWMNKDAPDAKYSPRADTPSKQMSAKSKLNFFNRKRISKFFSYYDLARDIATRHTRELFNSLEFKNELIKLCNGCK